MILLISITLIACNSDEDNDAESAEGTAGNTEEAENNGGSETGESIEEESSETTCSASTDESNNYETLVEGSTRMVATAY
ncbi:hypothetical protein [Oceanobacillus sojae]|uniref:hypothetical protein n=1 Tax=Oceanobacillus sojae TaxID=582851 RepID=UPI0021A6E906|nr:hypothetical protein [Oceanobacillus sojae]MCT1901099.1 hypothetical protein [Oceanobacillus sojae]